MMTLAAKHGYSMRRTEDHIQELGTAITSKMQPRHGNNVYQMIAFNITGFPQQLLGDVFSEESLTEETAAHSTWKLCTFPSLLAKLSPVSSRSTCVCSGLTKAFRTKSQPVIRNVAHLIPVFEATWAKLPNGLSRSYYNGMYVIVSESGAIDWPKNNDRNEIRFQDWEETAIRQQVLSDVLALGERGEPLSPGWWRQLGKEEKAREVEAEIANPRKRPKKPKPPKQPRLPRQARPPRAEPQVWDIAQILAEKKVATKAKRLYLVRWEGYNPAWEPMRISGRVGNPIDTWEPLRLMKDTEALQEWRAAGNLF